VNEESSSESPRPTTQVDPTPTAAAPSNPPALTGNLTQELAQLLAATIAQGQPVQRSLGGVPTGSELASLASLMQTASQRKLTPAFRDGLSALSYAPPQRPNPPAHPEQVDFGHDDEPMPIPSTWREPVGGDHDRSFRQQMGAAFMGLFAGLLIVVPSVLWLSGWISGAKPKAETAPPAVFAPGEFANSGGIRTARVPVRTIEPPAYAAAAGVVQPRAAASEEAVPAHTASVAQTRPDDPLQEADARLQKGDVAGARQILAPLEGAPLGESIEQGRALLMLAKTYDPNMLAAWEARGVSADVARARALYLKALSKGAGEAMTRLDLLELK
jgi:hypothetical protein